MDNIYGSFMESNVVKNEMNVNVFCPICSMINLEPIIHIGCENIISCKKCFKILLKKKDNNLNLSENNNQNATCPLCRAKIGNVMTHNKRVMSMSDVILNMKLESTGK